MLEIYKKGLMNTDFLQGKRILIAEDDFVNQKLITHSLTPTGVAFDIAGNGLEAIELLRKGDYDLILMDINMPEMDGFEATQIIRKDINSSIPIIAMTGWSSRTEGDKFTKVGMNGCLAKPFGLDALYKTLDEIFQTNPDINTTATTETVIAPTVDMHMLNELAEGDIEYKATIINMFLESMPDTIRQMEQNIDSQDWSSLYKSAHYAKSSLSVIKVAEMYQLAHSIENSAKQQHQLETIPVALKLFNKNFEAVRDILLKELENLS
jgi:CheY-like chemotaxis protein